MRILLIQPGEGKGLGFRNLAVVEPLGLELVAGGLTGHDLHLVDLRLEDGLAETVATFRPDICGINCSFTTDLYRALEAATVAKTSAERPPFIVVGGHHASLNPSDLNHPSVDAIAIGEGEQTMPELVACLAKGGDLKQVPGLVLNKNGKQVRTGVRRLIGNLDALPFAARDLSSRYRRRYYLSMERPVAVVETARGCPYHCNFCSVWRYYRGRFRAKSPERVADEVARINERYILFCDDNFLADIDRARQIALLLKQRRLRHAFGIQARSDSIVAHPEIIKLLREVGLSGVFIGMEKINDEGLSLVNKNNSAANNERALDIVRKTGAGVTGSFIVDPDWSPADFSALSRYVRKLRIETPSFSVLTPLPGTVLYRQLRDRLQTHDYELFDLFHAVIPTALPLPEFYAELAKLYRSAYTQRQLFWSEIELVRRAVLWRSLSFSHLGCLIRAGRRYTNAASYLAAHAAKPHPA